MFVPGAVSTGVQEHELPWLGCDAWPARREAQLDDVFGWAGEARHGVVRGRQQAAHQQFFVEIAEESGSPGNEDKHDSDDGIQSACSRDKGWSHLCFTLLQQGKGRWRRPCKDNQRLCFTREREQLYFEADRRKY